MRPNFVKRIADARRPKPKIIAIENVMGFTPEQVAEMEKRVTELRLNGRPQGAFLDIIRSELMASGREAPIVIESEGTGTTTVPASLPGLLVHLASWDSLLLDEELQVVKNVVDGMVAMGLNLQNERRNAEHELREAEAHMREEHPERYKASQGVPV